MQLSPSFTLLELTHSETAERRGISNEPLPEHVENLRHTAQQLERVRTALNGAPILISSGYGTPELNRALGRAPTSEHLSGLAIDFRAPAFGSPYDVAAAIAASPELMAEIDQVYVEFNQWVHLSFGPRRRGQVLTMYRKPDDGRTYFLAGLHRLDRNGYLIDPPPEPAAAP